jgi:hypothetical protein
MRRFLKRHSRRTWSCSCRRCVSCLAFASAALASYEADDRPSPRFAQGVRLLPNPCQFSINEVAFGVASVDVLWALKSQEFFRKCGDAEPLKEGEKEDPGAKDVMARVGRHLLRQRRCVRVVFSFPLPVLLSEGPELIHQADILPAQLLPRLPLPSRLEDARRSQPRHHALRPREHGQERWRTGYRYCAVDSEALYEGESAFLPRSLLSTSSSCSSISTFRRTSFAFHMD